MKKIFFALVAILALGSCIREELPSGDIARGDTFDLKFSVVVPEMHTATRAMGTEEIKKLHLYIFDENGYLSQAKEAILLGEDTSNSYEDTVASNFRVEEVYESKLKRTVHFIANLPENAKTSFGSEQELINSMYTDGSEAFWQRMVFEDGLNADTKITNVPLVRNYAQVTVVSEVGTDVLTDISFVLANTPDRGTVAPYIVSEQDYAEYPINVTDPALAYETISATGYIGHEPGGLSLLNTTFAGTGDSGATFNANPKYLYERTHVDKDKRLLTEKPTFAIIKGKFGGSNSFTYYKVDFVDTNSNYINILRNFEYRIVIKGVKSAGYNNASDAAVKAASNNIDLAVETRDLTSITNGTGALYVSATQIVHNDPTKPIELKYRYIPDITKKGTVTNNPTTQSNGPVEITLSTADDEHPAVVSSMSVASTDVEGWRTIQFTPTALGTSAKSQDVYIKAGGMTRIVQLILTESPDLTAFGVAQPKVGNVAQSDVDVVITLPTNLFEGMFPLDFVIVSDKLTIAPNPLRNSLPVVTNRAVNGAEGGRYYGYTAVIEWEDYAIYNDEGKIVGYNQAFPFYFLSNTANSASTIWAYNKYFGSTDAAFTNGAVPEFDLDPINNSTNRVTLTLPTGLDFGGVNQVVTLTYYPVDATITGATNGAVVDNGVLTIPVNVYTSGKYSFDLTFNCPNGATYVTVSHIAMRSASIEIK